MGLSRSYKINTLKQNKRAHIDRKQRNSPIRGAEPSTAHGGLFVRKYFRPKAKLMWLSRIQKTVHMRLLFLLRTEEIFKAIMIEKFSKLTSDTNPQTQ